MKNENHTDKKTNLHKIYTAPVTGRPSDMKEMGDAGGEGSGCKALFTRQRSQAERENSWCVLGFRLQDNGARRRRKRNFLKTLGLRLRADRGNAAACTSSRKRGPKCHHKPRQL